MYALLQDEQYKQAGATIVDTSGAFQTDIMLKVQPPDVNSEASMFKAGSCLVSYIQPDVNEVLVDRLQDKEMAVIVAV